MRFRATLLGFASRNPSAIRSSEPSCFRILKPDRLIAANVTVGNAAMSLVLCVCVCLHDRFAAALQTIAGCLARAPDQGPVCVCTSLVQEIRVHNPSVAALTGSTVSCPRINSLLQGGKGSSDKPCRTKPNHWSGKQWLITTVYLLGFASGPTVALESPTLQ